MNTKEKGCEFITSFSQPKPKTKNYEKTLVSYMGLQIYN